MIGRVRRSGPDGRNRVEDGRSVLHSDDDQGRRLGGEHESLLRIESFIVVWDCLVERIGRNASGQERLLPYVTDKLLDPMMQP